MEKRFDANATPQGFGNTKTERLPCPERSAMNGAQRTAADAIINGPRKAIFGPFVPLLQTPVLLEHVGKVGETLRFQARCRTTSVNLPYALSRERQGTSSNGKRTLH